MTYPGILFWLAAIWAMRSKGPALYYMFFICWSLGTLAVVPLQLGNFTPAWIVAALMTAKVMMDVGVKRYGLALVDPRRFGFLSLCTLYATASAYFLPRFFQGQVEVIDMWLTTGKPVPLNPSGANINQTMYFILGSLIVVDVYFICIDPKKRRGFLDAFAWGAVVAMITGLMDLAASRAGLGVVLAPFRNAAYAIMADNDAMNMHRVIGLMSEASSYASLLLPFLSLIALTPRDAGAPWRRRSLLLTGGLVVMVYLSTSSSGYVALGAVAAVVAASLAIGVSLRRRDAWIGAYAMLVAATGGVAMLLLAPGIGDSLYRVIDAMVLNKSASSSYIERSFWNQTGYQAFRGTHGLGAGSGSARTSSWLVALLANIGLPGTGLLAIFFGQALISRAPRTEERLLARAAKLALAPNVLMLSLSGTSAAFGAGMATLLGLICALGWPNAAAAARRKSAQAQFLAEQPNQVVGVFVDEPVHVLFLSTAKPIAPGSEPYRPPGATRSLAKRLQGGLRAMDSRAKRNHAFKRFLDRLETEIPEDLYVHMILYALPGTATPSVDHWLASHPRWSCDFDTFEAIPTADWLQAIIAHLAGQRQSGKLERSQIAELRELLDRCRQVSGPNRLSWVSRAFKAMSQDEIRAA